MHVVCAVLGLRLKLTTVVNSRQVYACKTVTSLFECKLMIHEYYQHQVYHQMDQMITDLYVDRF